MPAAFAKPMIAYLAALGVFFISACVSVEPSQPVVSQPPAAQPRPVADSPPRRLVVLMITDNSDHQHPNNAPGSIAAGTTANEKVMDAFFDLVRVSTDMVVDKHKIVGRASPPDPFDCDNVSRAIQDLPVSDGDAVMVYYSGHGFNIGTEDPARASAMVRAIAPPEFRDRRVTKFPFLACGTSLTNSPNLDMIAAWLSAKHPRLTLVMADACNSYLTGTGPAPETFYAAASVGTITPDQRLRSLFRDAQGTVLMAGSEPGHYSYYSVSAPAELGGVFTLLFRDTLTKLPRDKPISWGELGAKIGSRTVTVEGGAQDTQRPFILQGEPFATSVLPQS